MQRVFSLCYFYTRVAATKLRFTMWRAGADLSHIEQIHTTPHVNSAKARPTLTPQQKWRIELRKKVALAKQQFFRQQQSLEQTQLHQAPSQWQSLEQTQLHQAPSQWQSLERAQQHEDHLEQDSILSSMDLHSSNGHCEQCGEPSSSSSNGRITLSIQQAEVLRAVAEGRSVFITGSAGTGKSFLLKHVIRVLKEVYRPQDVFVTASTGVAACAINGQTLHSFAGVGLGTGEKEVLFRKASANKQVSKRWKKVKALVIDEVSMIDGEFFDSLEFIARRMRCENKLENQVWGGIQLIVSGDFFQLPPINAPNPVKEFSFEADCWNSSFDLQVELVRIFRQSDSRLIELLQAIRRGHVNLNHLNFLDNCSTKTKLNSKWEQIVTRLYPRNEDVRKVNNEKMRSLGGEIITYRAMDSGREPWISQLKQGIAPEELELCVGARVMLLKNTDTGAGLVNGTTGVVTGFVKQKKSEVSALCFSGLLPKVRFDMGLEMEIRPETWDVMEGEKIKATRRQVPLMLAWALSVHKCQGMTLDFLHTDLSRAFGYGMVYVALSRVRSLDGLYLSGFNPRKVKAHPRVVEFYGRLLSGQAG